MLTPPVSRYMTRDPCVIRPEVTIAEAHALMRSKCVRHLPVLRGTTLVGLVSDRELYRQTVAGGHDPDRVTVEDIMIRDVAAVPPQAELPEVAELMRARNCGSVVVVDHGRVVGIFTSTDALCALNEIVCRET